MPVEKVAVSTPQSVPADARPAPIGFNKLRYAVPTGTTTVGYSMRSPRCPLIIKKAQRGLWDRTFVNDDYRRLFQDSLEGLGYDITGDPGRLFDEAADLQRTLYAVGGRITDIKMDVCDEESFLFGHGLGTIGEGMLEVEWTVYDLLKERNIYTTTTKGYAQLKTANDEGLDLLLQESFAAATHNLGADPAFFDLVFYGKEPDNIPDTYIRAQDTPLPHYDITDRIILAAQPPYTAPSHLQNHIDQTRRQTVMIQAGGGHGSGLIINDEGYIITNAHVVGYAPVVRVVLSGKEEATTADVIRVDRTRDVAVIKLKSLPASITTTGLPYRLNKPPVSTEIYAIGAPLTTDLQDTITKGIISAHRYDKRKNIWHIQGDVYVYGGNSGGPLLDEYGNIVGITVSGYRDHTQTLTGLNLFIPIADALDALEIELDQ